MKLTVTDDGWTSGINTSTVLFFVMLLGMDDQTAIELFAAIVTFTAAENSYATRTKLLKLLYLFDVEYFRIHRRTFTGFDWKFLHLGPWTAQYEELVTTALAGGQLSERMSKRDTALLYAPEKIDTSELKLPVKDEGLLRQVLHRWAGAETSEILDYVYFNTEPMLHGVRSLPLDFSSIQELPPIYKRTSSGATSKEIEARRRVFKEKHPQPAKARITPPRYDESFDRAIATMQSED
jgi:hypothetical protein